MRELGRKPNLAKKALGAGVSDALIEDFNRDGAIVAEVARQIDGGHPAATELTLHGVAIGECGPQTRRRREAVSRAFGGRHLAKLGYLMESFLSRRS